MQRKDGNEYDGLLHTCQAESASLSVVIFGARHRVAPSAPVSKVIKQLAIEANDIVQARRRPPALRLCRPRPLCALAAAADAPLPTVRQIIARDVDLFSAGVDGAAVKNKGEVLGDTEIEVEGGRAHFGAPLILEPPPRCTTQSAASMREPGRHT